MLRNQNSADRSDSDEAEIGTEATSNRDSSPKGLAGVFGKADYSYGLPDKGYSYLLNDDLLNKYPAPDVATFAQLQNSNSQDFGAVVNEWKPIESDQPAKEVQAKAPRKGGFSDNFKFKPTLLNIFWKIDSNQDARLSKQELHVAIRHEKFHDDEDLLAGLLLQHFDYIRSNKITSSRFFDSRGLSVDEIMSYPWATFVPPDSLPDPNATSTNSRLKALPKPEATITNTRLKTIRRTGER